MTGASRSGTAVVPQGVGTNGNRLLMGLAERADLIVDFTNVPVGNHVLRNVGPDEPFGGGVPGVDFESADPDSTGQVLQSRVVPAVGADPTTPPQFLVLPAITALTGGRPGRWPCWRRPRSSSRILRSRHCWALWTAIRTRHPNRIGPVQPGQPSQ